MSIYAIRHADKEPGEFYDANIPLNNQPISEMGRQQASSLVDYFRDIDISSIHVSQYIRTQQTIDKVARAKQLSPRVDPRLNEINIGVLDQLTDAQVESSYPEFWNLYLKRDHDFKFPNGESGDEAGTRIFDLFSGLDPTQNHILVAHDGIIRILICKVLSIPTFRRHLFSIDYCSITTFEYSQQFNCWTVPRINMTIYGNHNQ